MDIVATILVELGKCIAPSACRCLDRHQKFKQDEDELRRRVRDLNSSKEDRETQIRAEDLSNKLVRKQVEDWLKDVQKINEEMLVIEEKVKKVSCFHRAPLGKQVREKIADVERTSELGCFPDGLFIDRPQPVGIPLPTETLVGEVDVKDQIWRYLRGHEVGMIGIFGIGGVGKTTIMKHIQNELMNEATMFQKVIWVTVSHPLNVAKLQHDIARKMNGSLGEDCDELERSSRLMEIMKNVKYALILDDVWDRFILQNVGIPEPTMDNGCKVVITSRSVDVCHYLKCEIVKVPPLSNQESLKLFLDKVGPDVLQIPHWEGILKPMVAECAGLPLAIVVIARSMRGVTDIHEWSDALRKLKQCVVGADKDSEDEIFNRLKFSYERLRDSSIKNCFLYCSLYPEDYEIRREDLIENWICGGLVEKLGSRREMHDKGHAILNGLENNCLLEKTYIVEEECVKMHDVVRDMALRIKSTGPGRFIVKAGTGLTTIPAEDEWTGDLDKVSLMENEISYIPMNMSPKCLMLSTLILEANRRLRKIPECFFTNMPLLKFLNLSSTGIEALPNSVCNLKNLTTLILRQCRSLKRMPSLAKLKALKKLDLSQAGLVVVPEGIKMLKNLEYFDLSCPNLRELPAGTISKLFRLQYLCKHKIFSTEIRGEEVARLKMLECFEGGFEKLKDFNSFVSKLNDFGSPRCYLLEVGVVDDDWEGYFWKFNSHFGRPSSYLWNIAHMDTFDEWYFGKINNNAAVKRVTLVDCEIGGEGELVLPDDVQDLRIESCNTGIGWAVSSSLTVMNNLEKLSLWGLDDLRDVVKGERTTASHAPTISPHIFSNLQQLNVYGCSKLNKLFPCELLQGQGLQYLEQIRVEFCDEMEEIIGWEGNQTTTTPILITLPKLRILDLTGVPELKRICPERGVMVCDSLNSISIEDIEKVKRIPFRLGRENGQPPLPALEKIYIGNPKEWWESVEWENPEDKNVLLPFVKSFDNSSWVRVDYPPV